MAIKVVNMIPNSLSNESGRDSEPNVTVSFLDPSNIAASVFTLDPLNSGNAPIYVSTDGGDTWTLNVILPGGNKTLDTSMRFVGPSNILYAGIIRLDNAALNILRKASFTAPGLADILVTKTDSDDQPYVEGAMELAGAGTGDDRVYVGENEIGAPGGQTATIDFSLNAATAPPPAGFVTTTRVEKRATFAQDAPAVRPAAHLDGTIYGAFLSWQSATTMDVVVVRDDNWAAGANPFTDLLDGGTAGKRVSIGVNRPPFNTLLGTQRVGGSVAIAVDPGDSSIVYLAWSDGPAAANLTIHVRRSTDRGVNWSGDLRTIIAATNPALAINQNGQVGFLYQKLHNPGSGDRWQTHFEVSDDAFVTSQDLVLADLPDANGSYTGPNPIGDYDGVVATGKNFLGVFCGNNTPDNANFPNGVTYQRNANFTTHTLLDLASSPVPASIDPFFFKYTMVNPADDFYVRDWTDSPVSGDNGAEPSTHPVFYATSDVWNRRGTLPGPFPNDQPSNEDAGNGAGNVGDNWAFARIRRNVPAAAGTQNVTAHFLVSKFGTGSNFVDASSGDPDVTFVDPDPSVPFNAADVGPIITPAVHWHLNPVASTHLCLAVEITGPNDPFIPPSLVGNAPGWPTTDLLIINDNNKAQRNMGLSTTPARGVGMSDCFYAIAHNAATFTRNVELRYEAPSEAGKLLEGAAVEIIGAEEHKPAQRGVITLPGVRPGENRWIGLRFPAVSGREGSVLTVNFFEVVNGVPVNGFAIGTRLASTAVVIRDRLERHRSLFTRFDANSSLPAARESAERARKLSESEVSEAEYVAFVREELGRMQEVLHGATQKQDPFGIARALTDLVRTTERGAPDGIALAHGCVCSRSDSYLTMLRLAEGDVADILQNVRWQRRIYTLHDEVRRLECAAAVRRESEVFIRGYGARHASNRDYPELIRNLLGCFEATARAVRREDVEEHVASMRQNLNDLRRLQKAHWSFLVAVQG